MLLWQLNLESADVLAPSLSSPTGTATGQTTASGSVVSDEAGTGYWVVTQSATSPSVAQVQAGQDHLGAAADDSGSASWSIGVNPVSATGLVASTTYYFHYQEQDAGTNDSTVVTSAGFTTFAVPAASPSTSGKRRGLHLIGRR